MTVANADRCIANTLVYEGPYGRNAKDRGDWTSGRIGVGRLAGTAYGISAMTLVARGLPATFDLKTLTRSQAIALFRAKEWRECRGDELPKGFDQITYDAVVNSGIGRIDWTGRAVGATNPKNVGQVVMAAGAVPKKKRGAAVKKAIAYRLSFLKALTIAPTFIGGWTRRCVGMEAIGVKMVLEDQGVPPAPELEKEAKGARKKRDGAGTAAGGAATTGGGTATQVEPSAWDALTWFLAGMGVMALILLMIFLAFQAWKNQERMKAYLDAARGLIGG